METHQSKKTEQRWGSERVGWVGIKDKGLWGFEYRDCGLGEYQATRGVWGEKVFIAWGIRVYGVMPGGLGKWPWGSKQWGISGD